MTRTTRMRRGVAQVLIPCLLALALLSACDLGLSSITNAIQNTIDQVGQQSDAWRNALPQLVDQLQGLESQATGDVKDTLTGTVNEVQSLSTQTLTTASLLAKDTIAFGLIEVECSASYFQSSVTSYLRRLKAWVTNHAAPLPAERVCTFNPDHLDVNPQDVTNSGKTWLIQVYGYNFFGQALPKVQIQNGQNVTVRTAANKPVLTSLYQLQLQLVPSDFQGLQQGYRAQLAWPDGATNAIAIDLSAPASLTATNLAFPATVTVNQPVVPQLTIHNGGTSDSGSFVIHWTPDSANPGQIVTQTELSLAGGATQTYDLTSHTYPQRTYFDIPTATPKANNETIVQIVGNAGVLTQAAVTRTFTIANLPFQAVPAYRIDQPNVNTDWTSYAGQVRVQPGDIVTVTAGGCVQTGGSGQTWKRYVDPDASDAPNLYHGLIAITPPMTMTHGQPPTGTRLQAIVGTPIAIPLSTNPAPTLWLGYEDRNYSDNGYWGHDNGTNNQCAGVGNAYVIINILRN